ncbi:unnamed protein product [Taenia asiatica]|uniref:Uncharacterized protein n=1 Tax=Taenia asiatica TaxID=60517 RepID=A0A0R3W2W1_TAEAS|nr:unnamed protein product [Taenia asiatica]
MRSGILIIRSSSKRLVHIEKMAHWVRVMHKPQQQQQQQQQQELASLLPPLPPPLPGNPVNATPAIQGVARGWGNFGKQSTTLFPQQRRFKHCPL